MRKKPKRRITRLLVHAIGHLLALGCVLGAVAVALLEPVHFDLLQHGLDDPLLRGALLRTLAATAVCCAGIWGLTFGLVARAARRRRTRRVRLHPRRGTILTETLIVLPVYLMFVFGLAQLTINNAAGLLASLASYEAARTLAVWGPEVAEGRRDATHELAIDKARVAAAGVITPVVPRNIAVNCRVSRTLDLHMRGLESAGNLPLQDIPTFGQKKTLAGSFDNDALAARGLPKLKKAYCSTKITVDGGEVVPGEPFTVRVEYEHANVVPLTGRMFGDEYKPGVGHVQLFRRAYRGTAQLQPNSVDPRCRFCPDGVNSIY